ncbi:MAG: aminotransferase class V-fold PLP-dependent enzyme [Myxococcaceae bacterium]|nr:aminotransferase class V-fold PLP-dependent enzyme [Myxococcaceae bacterium]
MQREWTYQDFVKDALTRVPEVSCEVLREKCRERCVVLDVREPDELQTGMIPGATVLPRGLVEKHAHEHIPAKDVPIYVYCSTGNRSALVADTLLKMGYRKVFNVAGGIERWQHLGLPLEGQSAVCRVPNARLNWEEVRREFAIVGRHVPVLGSGERALVYLDHAASTHAPKTVLDAYVHFVTQEYANVHRGASFLARKATERFDESYYIVADFIGAELRKGCIAFTSNTTQAIDLAAHVMAHRPGKVITTEMEHHSNELTHRRHGPVLRCRVTDDGELDLDHLEDLLRKHEVKLVAVTMGSNVTGIMPDLGRIARMAHENGALVLADAAQALARTPIDVKPFDDPEHIDFLAGAGHKAYAPFGAGFLYGPRALMDEAPPYIPGGGTAAQVSTHGAEYLRAPDRHHGGTPNIAGVVGMARALQFLQSIGMKEIRAHEVKLVDRMLRGLKRIGGITLYGPADPEKRLGVVSFNVNGVSDLLAAAVLSEEGAVAVRNGRFCSHIYVDRLLAAAAKRQGGETQGSAEAAPTGAVRASVGLYNDESDIDRLLEYVERIRDRKWMGRYRVKGESVSAEFAGRCADRWMESTQDADHPMSDPDASAYGYLFEVLQPDGGCRTYLVADPETGDAMLVDPLREKVDEYVDLLQAKRLRLRYTVETHTHADHLSGSARLKDLTGCQMLMHAQSPAPCVDRGLQDGDTIELGKLRIDVIATPGHTADSVCLSLPGRVLTGDTLLINACGRTDLPTGDSEALYHSLHRLMSLPDDAIVCPAHEYNGRRASTIGRERKSNPRLQLKSAPEFVKAMREMNLPPPARMREAIQNNLKCL